jgi:putative ABC transport system permease protein
MKSFPGLDIALVSLKARKTRAALASLGVVIGIAAVIIMVAVGNGSKKEVLDIIRQMGENLVTIGAGELKRRGGKMQLTGNVTTLRPKDATALVEEIPEIERAVPFHSESLRIKYAQNAFRSNVSGTIPEFMDVRKYSVETGEPITEDHVRNAARVAVLGKTAVENIFGGENPIGQTFRIEFIPFTVIGVFVEKGSDSDGEDQDDIIMIPISSLLRRVLNQTFINNIYVQAVSRKDIDLIIPKITEVLRERHKLQDDSEDDFTIRSQLELEKVKVETTETMTKLTVGVAGISLVVGGIGILAVMLISVKERTREVGVRRAVGATRSDIVKQFLWESAVIGFLGGVVGAAAGAGIVLALAAWSPWTLILSHLSVVVSCGICLTIGLLFGLYPAIKASRLDPMDALRVE